MLPHESRCDGKSCIVRGQCLRYIERNDMSSHTPMYSRQPGSVYPCPLYRASTDQSVITTNKTGV